MKSTTCRLPAPRPASTRAIACRTSPLACTSRSRCSNLRDDRAAVKRPRYARGRLTFGAGAGMFSGPGNVSAFFERLRAALAPDYELLRELGSGGMGDRKSTRLNSSHGYISYAVFCLKKKKKRKQQVTQKVNLAT